MKRPPQSRQTREATYTRTFNVRVIKVVRSWLAPTSVILCLALAAPLPLVAQGSLRAPRPGLADIPLPSLENLEQSVASQIESLQKVAAAAIQNTAASDAELAQAYGNLGVLHHGYELGDAAKPSYANAARLAPRDFRWPYLLGHLAGERGDLAGAASSYELAASLNERYTAVWVNLGKTYRDLGRLDNASGALQNALTLDPDSPAALAASGEVELRQRHFEQAVWHAPLS